MSLLKPHFRLFTEARPSTRPGVAEWRFVLEPSESSESSLRLEAGDEESDSPLERLELLAVVRGLESLDQPSHVTLSTPSRYVSRGLRFGLEQWRENGWQWESFGQMQPVKNVDLWKRIDQTLHIHRVDLHLLRLDAAHSLNGVTNSEAAGGEAVALPQRRRSRSGSTPEERKPRSIPGRVSAWLHSLGERFVPALSATHS